MTNDFDDIDPKDIKIEFAPGCFDDFDGSNLRISECCTASIIVKNGVEVCEECGQPCLEAEEDFED